MGQGEAEFDAFLIRRNRIRFGEVEEHAAVGALIEFNLAGCERVMAGAKDRCRAFDVILQPLFFFRTERVIRIRRRGRSTDGGNRQPDDRNHVFVQWLQGRGIRRLSGFPGDCQAHD